MNAYTVDDIYNGYRYYDSDDDYDEEYDHYEPVPVDLDQLVESYSDEFAKLDAQICKCLDYIRITRKARGIGFEIGSAINERTLQEQLGLLMWGAQIEKIKTESPLIVESLGRRYDPERDRSEVPMKVRTMDNRYVIHITFHNSRAYGQVVKRQDLSELTQQTDKVDVRVNGHSMLRSTYPVDTTEVDIAEEIQNAIDVLKPIEMKLVAK